jgi:hypothetical protein
MRKGVMSSGPRCMAPNKAISRLSVSGVYHRVSEGHSRLLLQGQAGVHLLALAVV